MKANELLDAIGLIKDDYVNDAMNCKKRKKKTVTIWRMAVAACLCAAVVLLCIFGVSNYIYVPMNSTVDTLNYNIVSQDKLTGVQYKEIVGKKPSGGVADGQPDFSFGLEPELAFPEFRFACGIAVEAYVKEVLPDVYVETGRYRKAPEYKVLKLEVCDVIVGEGVPNEIYYMVPAITADYIAGYERLVLGIEQLGLENYILINNNTNHIESFRFLFGISRADYATYAPAGSVIAFTGGKLDESIWEEKYWKNSFTISLKDKYPARPGCTIQYTKNKIRELNNDKDDYDNFDTLKKVLTFDTLLCDETADVIEYLSSLENGVFTNECHRYNDGVTVFYSRIINGFYSDEKIRITMPGENGEKASVTYMGPRFTESDMESIPDIGSIIEGLDIENIVPRHTKGYAALFRLSCSALGWYSKTDDGVYGVVKVAWRFCKKDDYYTQYYDDMYLIAFSDGTYKEVEREELREYIGDNAHISTWEYGVGIPVPML